MARVFGVLPGILIGTGSILDHPCDGITIRDSFPFLNFQLDHEGGHYLQLDKDWPQNQKSMRFMRTALDPKGSPYPCLSGNICQTLLLKL